MIEWITGTVMGKFLTTLLISMVPVIELRGGLPYGLAMGLDYKLALTAAILGNLIPVPFIILFVRTVFSFLKSKSKRLRKWVTSLEEKANKKGDVVRKYNNIGLFLFVAIPLPGTGAWTGSMIAALLDMRLKRSVPWISLGVVTAALIITALYYGGYFVLFS